MQGIDFNTRHNMEMIADYSLCNICDEFERLAALLNRSDDFNEYEDA